MKCCKKATESLKETGLEIIVSSVVSGYFTNDLRISSIMNTIWDLTKYVVQNDKETQKNIGTFISCHLGM